MLSSALVSCWNEAAGHRHVFLCASVASGKQQTGEEDWELCILVPEFAISPQNTKYLNITSIISYLFLE